MSDRQKPHFGRSATNGARETDNTMRHVGDAADDLIVDPDRGGAHIESVEAERRAKTAGALRSEMSVVDLLRNEPDDDAGNESGLSNNSGAAQERVKK